MATPLFVPLLTPLAPNRAYSCLPWRSSYLSEWYRSASGTDVDALPAANLDRPAPTMSVVSLSLSRQVKGKVAHEPRMPTRPELISVSVAWSNLEYCYSRRPGWDASPSQGYPQQYVAGTHLHTWAEWDNVELSFLSKETTQWQNWNPSQLASHYNTAPPHCRDTVFFYLRFSWYPLLVGMAYRFNS